MSTTTHPELGREQQLEAPGTAPVAPGPRRPWLVDPVRSALADCFLLLLTAAATAACLSGGNGSARALLLLTAACVVPGGALLTRLPVRDLLEGLALAATLGFSTLTAGALAMVWTGWWHPALFAGATAAAACLLLLTDLVRNARVLRARPGGLAPRVQAWQRRLRASAPRHLVLSLPALVALVLWWLSLRHVDVYHLGSYGLPPALPLAWYCALLIAVAGGVTAISVSRTSNLAIVAYIVVIGIILFGTVSALSGQPHYAWVYKHIGVVRYLEQHGQVNLNADIYNRWPGFFALAAMLSPIAGRANPATYAAWADLFFLLLEAALVAAVVRTVIRSARIAAGAALLFVVTNWVGQTYFSPQTFGFALGLGTLLIVLGRLRTDGSRRSRRLRALLERIGRAPQASAPADDACGWPAWASIVAVLGTYAIVVASHQLTPYILLASIALLMLAGIVRPWWLLPPMAVMAFAYLAANLTFVQHHYGLFTSIDPFNNVQGVNITPNTPVPGKVFNTNIQLVLIGALWITGIFSTVRLLRRGLLLQGFSFVILAACPFVVVFGQSYGGEAPLRIILFSSPWIGALIAWALATVERVRLRFALGMSIALVFTALFVPSFLGQEELNVISAPELQASAHFYRHARPGSVLVLAAPGFPYRYGASYTRFSGPEGDANPNLMTEPSFQSRQLGAAQVPKVVGRIQTYTPHGYLAFTRNETLFARIFNITPPGALANLEAAIARSPRFRLWYRNSRVRIYELVAGDHRPRRRA
jgi:hypothetical protein